MGPLAIAGALGAGKLISGITDIFGGNKAADALKAAQANARNDLTAGYGEAKGYQKPVYNTALGNYTGLSDKYAAGGFQNPHMDPYKFDPQSVFQDPEYAAQMKAGTEAINSGAENKGLLFSGVNDRDLTKFGQDTFAGRSDDLYKRGFDATNTAYNQNAQNNLTSFNEGQQLTQPLTGATNQLSNLSTNEGTAFADNSLGSGQIRAGNVLRTSNALGGMAGDLSGIGADYLQNLGMPGVRQPKSSLI